MNICCPCGETLHPVMPVGRWAMDPTLFLRQNPFPLPLHHAILVSQQGESHVMCGDCDTGREVLWDIIYDCETDVQGGKVRYAMSEGVRFRVCRSCGMRRTEIDSGIFVPPVVDSMSPCNDCIHAVVEYGYSTHCFKTQGF